MLHCVVRLLSTAVRCPLPSDGSQQGSGRPLLSAPALPPYLQYGLPPNYRPSSGRHRPPSASGTIASAVVKTYDSDAEADDHDDADLEARLVHQIESNVIRAAGPALPPASRRAAGPCSSKASPGAYLPPRSGAASSGSLGASSAAAANAAAVAAGSRLGKAAAAAAAAGGGGCCGGVSGRQGMSSPSGASGSEYPEESEFEMQLQRQIDSDTASRGGMAGSGGGSGGGASWRGSSVGTAGRGRGGVAQWVANPGATAEGSGAAAVLKRTTSSGSVSSSGGSGGTTMMATAAAVASRHVSTSGALLSDKVRQ